jgi:hypothetical protein
MELVGLEPTTSWVRSLPGSALLGPNRLRETENVFLCLSMRPNEACRYLPITCQASGSRSCPRSRTDGGQQTSVRTVRAQPFERADKCAGPLVLDAFLRRP